MKESEKFYKTEQEIGERGMKMIEGHPICGGCLKNEHVHPLEEGKRHDCKNTDFIQGREYQCHCGFGGIYKNQKWEPWESWE